MGTGRRGWGGEEGRGYGGGGGEREGDNISIAIHRHHQNDCCIKMGSDESHFNVSFIARNKVSRLSTSHNLFKEKGEPKRY